MTFREIMQALADMYNSYDAACWLKRERRIFQGKSAADLMKDGEFKQVTIVLQKETRYKNLQKKQQG